MKRTLIILTAILLSTIVTKSITAHCEVPCGIYNDVLRIELIKEHIQTIEKAMNQINEFQNSKTINYNQLIRWINTKENHAELIQEIAEQYFLTQRVKFVEPNENEEYKKYISQLTYLHQLIVYSMKAKQSTNLDHINNLTKAVENFELVYFGKDAHSHEHGREHK